MKKNVIYFRGGRKGEELYFMGKHYDHSVGCIISDLMDLDESSFLSITKNLIILLQEVRNDFEKSHLLQQIQPAIQTIKASDFLKELFFYQPLIVSLSSSESAQTKYSFPRVTTIRKTI